MGGWLLVEALRAAHRVLPQLSSRESGRITDCHLLVERNVLLEKIAS